VSSADDALGGRFGVARHFNTLATGTVTTRTTESSAEPFPKLSSAG